MVLNQQPAKWTYNGRPLEHVSEVGSTGSSTGDHLHGELRNSKGQPIDWSNTEAASNVFFQRPDGAIDRLYQPDGENGFKINPAAVKTSSFGMRNHPIKGVQKFHAGNDYGLAGGTKLLVPRDILTGSFAGFNDPSGYGNAVDIPTKFGTLRFGHLKRPANKLTIENPPGSTQLASTPSVPDASSTESSPGESTQKIDGKTVINLAFNLGKEKEEKLSFADQMLKSYIGQIMNPPDYTKMITSLPNPYESLG